MNITEIAFTCYPATDLAASRAFYEDLIGLKPTHVHPMGKDGGWVEYEIGPHCFSIGKTDGWQPNPQGPSCGLEVEDFDKTVEELRAANVTITMGPMETPVCNMLMVLDPAGNTLIIHKRKPGHH